MLPDKVPWCHYDDPQIGLAQPFSHEVFGIQCQQELCAAFHRGRQYMSVLLFDEVAVVSDLSG